MNEAGYEHEIVMLKVALHDAINRPKGVVPKSAAEFYEPWIYYD